MNVRIVPAPVRKSIRVNASQAHAFDVFTARMGRWWKPEHHIGASPLKDVVMEPGPGGRWYEISEDGSMCDWGKVLTWDPPARIVLAWQLNGEWKYDPSFVTEVEVRFVPEGTGTRVELEHRHLERYGTSADSMRSSFDSPEGWAGSLAAFASEADGAQ